MGTPLELLKMFGPFAFFLLAVSVGHLLLDILRLSYLQRRRVAQCTRIKVTVAVLHLMSRSAALSTQRTVPMATASKFPRRSAVRFQRNLADRCHSRAAKMCQGRTVSMK